MFIMLLYRLRLRFFSGLLLLASVTCGIIIHFTHVYSIVSVHVSMCENKWWWFKYTSLGCKSVLFSNRSIKFHAKICMNCWNVHKSHSAYFLLDHSVQLASFNLAHPVFVQIRLYFSKYSFSNSEWNAAYTWVKKMPSYRRETALQGAL